MEQMEQMEQMETSTNYTDFVAFKAYDEDTSTNYTDYVAFIAYDEDTDTWTLDGDDVKFLRESKKGKVIKHIILPKHIKEQTGRTYIGLTKVLNDEGFVNEGKYVITARKKDKAKSTYASTSAFIPKKLAKYMSEEDYNFCVKAYEDAERERRVCSGRIPIHDLTENEIRRLISMIEENDGFLNIPSKSTYEYINEEKFDKILAIRDKATAAMNEAKAVASAKPAKPKKRAEKRKTYLEELKDLLKSIESDEN